MNFIKKHFIVLGLAILLVVNALLLQFQILVPVWALWLLIVAILGFVTWQIVKTFVNEWRKAKKQKERDQIIALGCAVAVLGIGIFCAIHFSGLQQRLFPAG
jgi:uncharacterized membrane protein YbhN (UPF0104 family)